MHIKETVKRTSHYMIFDPLKTGSIFTNHFQEYSLSLKFCTFEFYTPYLIKYTTQNLLRITFSFNDLMLKTNRLKKDFFYKDRLIFGLDDPVANMSIRHVYYA